MIRKRAPLWWRLVEQAFFFLVEIDYYLGYFPSLLLTSAVNSFSRPKKPDEVLIRTLYIQCAVCPHVYALFVFLLIKALGLEWRVTALFVVFYIICVTFFHFRQNKLIEQVSKSRALTRTRLIIQLRTVKMLFVCWGLVVMALIVFLP